MMSHENNLSLAIAASAGVLTFFALEAHDGFSPANALQERVHACAANLPSQPQIVSDPPEDCLEYLGEFFDFRTQLYALPEKATFEAEHLPDSDYNQHQMVEYARSSVMLAGLGAVVARTAMYLAFESSLSPHAPNQAPVQRPQTRFAGNISIRRTRRRQAVGPSEALDNYPDEIERRANQLKQQNNLDGDA